MDDIIGLDVDKRYLVAVSGGCDSMALLDMMVKGGYDIVAAHVNYRLRPTSGREERIVRDFCRAHDVPLFVCRPAPKDGNLENWARQARYGFFMRVYKRQGCDALLTAHQLDDHLETYLMALARGSQGWHYGIVSPAYHHGMLIERPLLAWRKADTRAYCLANGIPYHDDESNASDLYQRNRIRHEMVEPASPRQIADWCADIDRRNRRLDALYAGFEHDIGAADQLPLGYYRAAAFRTTLLRWYLWRLIPGHVWSQAFLEDIDRTLMKVSGNGHLKLTAGWELAYEYGTIYAWQPPVPYAYVIDSTRPRRTPYFRLARHGTTIEGLTLKPGDLPLTVRPWRAGDAIRMRFGTKTVARMMVDRKVPRRQRAVWPVAVNAAGRIIFVSGLGCDIDHFSIKPSLYVLK